MSLPRPLEGLTGLGRRGDERHALGRAHPPVTLMVRPTAGALPRAMRKSCPLGLRAIADLSKYLLCPMPGLVVSITVRPGDRVEAGQPLATVEAMKMENIPRAEKSATVKAVRASAGESLAVDAVILEFE